MCLKPGIARRHDGYDDEMTRCETTRVSASLNRLMVDKALALGTGDLLTAQERCLMMALCAHLHIEGVAAGETCVWPGAARLCRLLGMGESTLRRLKGSLEEKGFILRRYDHRNRPLTGGSLDLKPFLLRVEELCAAVSHTEATVRKERESLAHERYDHRPELSARASFSERATRKTQIQTSERPHQPMAAGEGKATTPISACDSAIVSKAEAIHPGISADPSKAAAEALGEKKGRRLWSWAERRRGPSAILALAIAVKSKKVKDPEAWFGWYATSAGEVDLEGLASTVSEAPKKASGPRDPVLAQFAEAFATTAGEGPALSYLSAGSAEKRDGVLLLRPASRMAAARLAERHADDLRRAAAASGFRAVRLGDGQEFAATPDEGEGRPDQPSGESAARKARPLRALLAQPRNGADAMPDRSSVVPADGGGRELHDEGQIDQHLKGEQRPIEKRGQGLGAQPDPVPMAVKHRETRLASSDRRAFMEDNS